MRDRLVSFSAKYVELQFYRLRLVRAIRHSAGSYIDNNTKFKLGILSKQIYYSYRALFLFLILFKQVPQQLPILVGNCFTYTLHFVRIYYSFAGKQTLSCNQLSSTKCMKIRLLPHFAIFVCCALRCHSYWICGTPFHKYTKRCDCERTSIYS